MRSIRKSAVTAFTAAIALSLGAIPVTFTAGILEADGTTSLTPAEAPPTPEAWLTLQTGSTDQVAFDVGRDNGLERTQALSTGRNCLLATDGTLLGFTGTSSATGTNNAASFSSDSIGVAEKKSGTSCYQVGMPDEKLTLTLNKDNLRGTLGPLLASSAVLDVELKQGAQILATLGKQGSTQVAYRELRSGSSITSWKPRPSGVPAAVESEVSICNNPADSGPDAGVLDNCLWVISNPSWMTEDDGVNFDILTLQVLNGSFSLEGGADGRVTNYSAPSSTPTIPDKPGEGALVPAGLSFFELSAIEDGFLSCPTAESTANTESIVRPLEGDKPEVKVRRIANAVVSTCLDIPYTLANGPGVATYYKPLNLESRAQFIVSLRWRLPAKPYTQIDTTPTDPNTGIYQKPSPADLPATTIDFEVLGEPGALKMGWCLDPIFSTTDPNRLEGINNPLTAPDMEPNLDLTQHACIGSRVAKSVKVGTADYYELSEQVYLLGDAAFRF